MRVGDGLCGGGGVLTWGVGLVECLAEHAWEGDGVGDASCWWDVLGFGRALWLYVVGLDSVFGRIHTFPFLRTFMKW